MCNLTGGDIGSYRVVNSLFVPDKIPKSIAKYKSIKL